MKLQDVIDMIQPEIDGIAANMGFELIQIKCSNNLVRVIADKPGGIKLDECALLSRKIGDVLDEKENEISEKYSLEVSSPGLYRPLVKPEHYREFIGQRISIETSEPKDGRRRFKGTLEDFRDNKVFLEIELSKEKICLMLGEIKKAQAEPDLSRGQ